MKETTMGKAVDEACERHERLHPDSAIYSARVSDHETQSGTWWVEIEAQHFSVPLHYAVSRM